LPGITREVHVMKKLSKFAMLIGLSLLFVGCARPFEIGWTPAYSAHERHDQIARNWDYEGKQLVDDFDSALLLRPASRMTIWNVR
jgi:hypothetical protein